MTVELALKVDKLLQLQAEAELSRQNPGKQVSANNPLVSAGESALDRASNLTGQLPRMGGNPTRVDRLVLETLREHSRVFYHFILQAFFFSSIYSLDPLFF